MALRTDKFSPNNLVPADYNCVCWFYNGAGVGLWPINLDYVRQIWENNKEKFANIHGGFFSCDVCGASYNEGELWQHNETGEYITLGHECARKYDMYSHNVAFENEKAKSIKARHNLQKRIAKRAEIKIILIENPGLHDALKTDHYIVRDIRNRIVTWGNVTPKQIELVFKIQKQENEKGQNEPNWISVPNNMISGRVKVEGEVLAAKFVDGPYGTAAKIFVKVNTSNGPFKAWGTLPEGGYPRNSDGQWTTLAEMRGKMVSFMARFQVANDDPTMSFFKRPSGFQVLEVN